MLVCIYDHHILTSASYSNIYNMELCMFLLIQFVSFLMTQLIVDYTGLYVDVRDTAPIAN